MDFDEFEQRNGGREKTKTPCTSNNCSTISTQVTPPYWNPHTSKLEPGPTIGSFEEAQQEYEDYMLYGPGWSKRNILPSD